VRYKDNDYADDDEDGADDVDGYVDDDGDGYVDVDDDYV